MAWTTPYHYQRTNVKPGASALPVTVQVGPSGTVSQRTVPRSALLPAELRLPPNTGSVRFDWGPPPEQRRGP